MKYIIIFNQTSYKIKRSLNLKHSEILQKLLCLDVRVREVGRVRAALKTERGAKLESLITTDLGKT